MRRLGFRCAQNLLFPFFLGLNCFTISSNISSKKNQVFEPSREVPFEAFFFEFVFLIFFEVFDFCFFFFYCFFLLCWQYDQQTQGNPLQVELEGKPTPPAVTPVVGGRFTRAFSQRLRAKVRKTLTSYSVGQREEHPTGSCSVLTRRTRRTSTNTGTQTTLQSLVLFHLMNH